MLDWLPKTVCVDPWTSDTYDKLYKIFCEDIRDANLKYSGYDVWIFQDKEDGKETIFWHLTSRSTKQTKIPRRKRKFYPMGKAYINEERLPDLRRCERLSWVRPLIEHKSEPEVMAWNYEEGDRTIKTYIWIKDYDFVVVMKKYPNHKRRLITSFYLDLPYKRKDLERKYKNRRT